MPHKPTPSSESLDAATRAEYVAIHAPKRSRRHIHTSHDETSSDNTSSDASNQQQHHQQQQPNQRSSSSAAPKRARAAPIHTYYARKDEVQRLQSQVCDLQSQLSTLQSSTSSAAATTSTTATTTQPPTELLHALVREQQFALAAVHGAVAAHARTLDTLPFESFIRLHGTTTERHATLATLRPQKIRDAVRYLHDRTRSSDLRTAFDDASRFTTTNRAYCILRIDNTVFESPSITVRDVYDALLQCFANMEISVSEAVGDIVMVRESDEPDDTITRSIRTGGVAQNRFHITGVGGVQTEMNLAMFTAYSNETNDDDESGAFGVIVGDAIDDDDRFPYDRTTRVRQDVAAVLTVRSLPLSASDSTQRVVVLTRVCLLRQHVAAFAIPPDVLTQVRASMAQSFDVMLDATRAVLETRSGTVK